MLRFALLVTLLAIPLAAQETPGAPVVAAQPEPRPDPEDRLDTVTPVTETLRDLPDPPRLGVYLQLMEDEATFSACTAALHTAGAVFTARPDAISEDDVDCGIARPVIVSEIVPGVALRPAATLRCEAALALAEWTTQHVMPAAQRVQTRGRLSALTLGGSYTCRRRNNLPTGRLSEHSFGNGIDIMAFNFETGDPIQVEPRMDEGTIEEAFQRSARATSCLYFTTVLGPGSNAAHADHLHLDIARRNGGYRLCQ